MAGTSPARIAYTRMLDIYKTHVQVSSAMSFIEFDQSVYMPPNSVSARTGAQFSVMQHSNNVCRAGVEQYRLAAVGISNGEFNRFELANLREGYRQLHATRDLAKGDDMQKYLYSVQQRQQLQNSFLAAWPRIKAQGDWAQYCEYFRALLRVIVESETLLCRTRAPFDNAMDRSSHGMTWNDVLAAEEELMTWWPSMRDRIRVKQDDEDARFGPPILPKLLDDSDADAVDAKTAKLLREVLTLLRFDFTRGCIVKAQAPFTAPPSFDVRIAHGRGVVDPMTSITAAFHESGHAVFEQGIPAHLWYLPVGNTDCKALHEAQAHFMEMCILRDPDFIPTAAALLTDVYGEDPAFDHNNLRRLSTHISRGEGRKVDVKRPGLRDDASMLASFLVNSRLEHDVFNGAVSIQDAPARLVELYGSMLRTEISVDDARAQLMSQQHWVQGSFGYTPVYVHGVLFATQLDKAMRRDLGEDTVRGGLREGTLGPQLGWLSDRIWSKGRMHARSQDLVVEATTEPVSTSGYKQFLCRRYGVSE
jgi:carboxypeptidase Taq